MRTTITPSGKQSRGLKLARLIQKTILLNLVAQICTTGHPHSQLQVQKLLDMHTYAALHCCQCWTCICYT